MKVTRISDLLRGQRRHKFAQKLAQLAAALRYVAGYGGQS
jgi:hypothetical protein